MKIIPLILLLTSWSLTAATQPNIVIMLADDLGAGDYPFLWQSGNKTPHLDQLAKDGLQFSDFYAASAVCSPSRAALQTGRFFRARGHIGSPLRKRCICELRKPRLLNSKAAGYATAHIGKWHLGYELTDDVLAPTGDHGYDHWQTGNNAAHHNPNNFVRNGKALGEVKGYSCQIVADEAIKWLDQRK